MMALKLLPILQVIIILCSPSYSYPAVYGTKRYGRLQRSSVPTWNSAAHLQPYQQMVRPQHYPVNYYEMYPYGQTYPDDYYYPHEAVTYPVYYPPAHTSKYEVYQAVLPYYYDRPLMRNGFGYYGLDENSDPMADLDDEVMTQDNDREQREDSQPIGQEMYYENDASNPDNFNDVNAAFLQNLIMSQMYKDSLDNPNTYNENDEIYGKLDEYPPSNKQNYYNEDEDVLELKQLARSFMQMPKQKEPTQEDRLHWFQNNGNKKTKHEKNNYYDDSMMDKRNMVNALPITDRKVGGARPFTTTAAPASTTTSRRVSRGQKEEVMLRPAAPVKHPFSSHVLTMMNKKDRERTPSVYDTIKHMLDMEKSLENAEDIKPAMRKRIVSSEDSLTHQLSVLKKQEFLLTGPPAPPQPEAAVAPEVAGLLAACFLYIFDLNVN